MGGRVRSRIAAVLIAGLFGTTIAACGTGAPAATTAASPAGASTGTSSAPSLEVPTITAIPGEPTTAPTEAPTTPPATVAPTPTANTTPRIASWDVPKYEDCTGSSAGSIDVSWDARRVTGVTISIDGPGIYSAYGPTGSSVAIPFGCDHTVLKHTYTLTTTGGSGAAASSTKTVTARPPSITLFEMGVPNCGPGDTTVGISMSFEIRAATGAELRKDSGLYSTYSTKATDDIVQFDCSMAFEVYKLTTTGGYGKEASKEVTVVHN